jgi:hypothetical protein
MSLQRQFNRNGANGVFKNNVKKGTINQHIIQRGIRNCRTFFRLGKRLDLARNRMIPMELHATKGWRYVAAWNK